MGRKREDKRFDPDDPNQFPARFRKCLNGEAGTRGKITNKAFCEATGMNTGTVSDYLKGRYGMPYDALIKTADFFGVPVGYLVGHEENPLSSWTDSDKRRVAFYTGLSEKIIEVLHTMRFGKEVSYQDREISDPYLEAIDAMRKGKDVSKQNLLDAMEKEPEYHFVKKTLYLHPNNEALTMLRALLEESMFEFQDEDEEGEWYANEEEPRLWSFFNIIYAMVFPQRELEKHNARESRKEQQSSSKYDFPKEKPFYVDDPDYFIFHAEKLFRSTIEELREKMNPEYGRDGLEWKSKRWDADHKRRMQEWIKNTDELLKSTELSTDAAAEGEK